MEVWSHLRPPYDEGDRIAYFHGRLALVSVNSCTRQDWSEPFAELAVMQIVVADAHCAGHLDLKSHVV